MTHCVKVFSLRFEKFLYLLEYPHSWDLRSIGFRRERFCERSDKVLTLKLSELCNLLCELTHRKLGSISCGEYDLRDTKERIIYLCKVSIREIPNSNLDSLLVVQYLLRQWRILIFCVMKTSSLSRSCEDV